MSTPPKLHTPKALACAALVLATASLAVAEASVVELRLERLEMLEAMSGRFVGTWGNLTHEEPFVARAGELLGVSHVFTNVPLASNQSIRLVDASNATVFWVETAFAGGSLTHVDHDIDHGRVRLDAQGSSVRIVAGSVSGTWVCRIAYQSPAHVASSEATVALDLNGDGLLAPGETFALTAANATHNATISVANAPATMAWRIAVRHEGSVIYAYRGVYDWTDGSMVTKEREVHNARVSDVLREVTLRPVRETFAGLYALPNAKLVDDFAATPTGGPLPEGWLADFWEPVGPGASEGAEDEGKRPLGPPPPPAPERVAPLVLIVAAAAFAAVGLAMVALRRRNSPRKLAEVHLRNLDDER